MFDIKTWVVVYRFSREESDCVYDEMSACETELKSDIFSTNIFWWSTEAERFFLFFSPFIRILMRTQPFQLLDNLFAIVSIGNKNI